MTSDIENNIIVYANSYEICERIIVAVIAGIIMLPFGVLNLYFAYSDTSCVNLPAGKLYVNLHDYLVVEGILLFVVYCIMVTINIKAIESLYVQIFGIINKLFMLCWNIIGAIIFWSLIDNTKCSVQIYNYMYASLIIKFVFTALDGLTKSKK